MKILIATPLFPPDIGGPATYTFSLAKRLSQKGIDILVMTYSQGVGIIWERTEQGFEKIEVPMSKVRGLRHLMFFWHILRNGKDVDLIYVHDIWSAGLPACLASLFLKKPLIVRLGGDSLWEAAVEKGITESALPDFYKKQEDKKLYFSEIFQNFVLKKCSKIIFSSQFLRDIFLEYRPVQETKSLVIENPNKLSFNKSLLEASDGSGKNNNIKTLLFAGRLTKCKNLDRLLKIFPALLKIDSSLRLKIVGDGPQSGRLMTLAAHQCLGAKIQFSGALTQTALFAEISRAYLCILLSLSEVSPNFALECLNLKKPLVLTKYNGLSENIKSKLKMIDPLNDEDIYSVISQLLEPDNYHNYCRIIETIELTRSWDDVVGEHLKIFAEDEKNNQKK